MPRPTRRTRTATAAALAGAALLAGCQHAELPRLPDLADIGEGWRRLLAALDLDAGAGPGAGQETLDPAIVRRAQLLLAKLGYRPGVPDGIAGAQTVAAIRRYQAAHRLPVTGALSPRLMTHLEARLRQTEAAARAVHTGAARPPASLAPEHLPAYAPWTSFVYSNGEVDRVTAVAGSLVHWRRSDGVTYAADRNFLLPWSYWASETGRGTAKVSASAEDLWPLAEGAGIAFSAEVAVQRADGAAPPEVHVEQWRCRNDGRRRITVPAGTFATVALTCRRAPGPGAPPAVRRWYYAESIRHYVRRIESRGDGGASETVDLVAVRPGAPGWPPIARAALGRAVMHALATADEGERISWTSSGVATRVVIAPTSRLVERAGRACRSFVQIWSADGRDRRFPALACKTASGEWEIPGLDNTAGAALASRSDSTVNR